MRPALGMKSCIIRLPIMQEDRGEKMVGIVLNDNAYEQDIRELLMAFCPGEEIVHEAHPSLRFCVEGILSEDRTEFELCLVFEGGSSFRALASRRSRQSAAQHGKAMC